MTPRLFWAAALLAMASVVGGYVVWQVTSFVRLPALELTSPETATLTGDTVRVAGVAAEDAEVTINGEQVLLAQGGQFETTLHVHEGINVIQVKAKNAAGRARIIKEDILVVE